MKKQILILAAILLLPFTVNATDNSAAAPKYNSSNENQVPWRTTDDGSGRQIQHVILSGSVAPSLPTGTRVSSTALEASHVLKSSAGVLIHLLVFNNKASTQYIQIFNSTTLPANGTAPAAVFEIQATSARAYDIPVTGLTFTTGIVVSNSSTVDTKTIGSADCYFTAEIQ